MRRLFCRHRYWVAVNTIYTEMDDAVIVSWTEMACVGCAKIRHTNKLKPRESISLEGIITEVTGEDLTH